MGFDGVSGLSSTPKLAADPYNPVKNCHPLCLWGHYGHAEEALIDAKTRLEPYLSEEIRADPTSVKWMADRKELLQLTQEHFPQESYPIWATVYSREQKWTIR